MTFVGFPTEALDFYDDLERDNTKLYWTAHQQVYETCVKAPMVELTAELEEEFGPAKVFRPYRDVRFSNDKTPYKQHQGAYVSSSSGSGWYVQISAAGVFVAVGYYQAASDVLAALRRAIADEHDGTDLAHLIADLERQGWTRGGETLKTRPQGYAADHPRIELLRHKSLVLRRDYGFAGVIHTPELLRTVRSDWRAARPFVGWVGMHSA